MREIQQKDHDLGKEQSNNRKGKEKRKRNKNQKFWLIIGWLPKRKEENKKEKLKKQKEKQR